MIEPLRVSLKSIDGRPVSRLQTASGRIIAHVFDDEYLWLFQQAASQELNKEWKHYGARVLNKIHFPDKSDDPTAD